MTLHLAAADRATLEDIVRRLEAAWNAMDGAAFAVEFAEDADFVNVRGEHVRGAAAIAAGHAAIFATIYAGSTNAYTLETARLLRPDVALVHVSARLDVPAGPLAGRHQARFSLVLTGESGGWRVAAFHNTPDAAGTPR
jgi:uncharacterized protein (TIGR02246 family)